VILVKLLSTAGTGTFYARSRPRLSPKLSMIKYDPSLGDSDAKWVSLQRLVYRDHHGEERVWECANRRTRTGVCDAAIIVPILRTSTERRIVLVRQFRPPVGKVCVEFPAGLLDPSESAEETALRELKEETGYVGRVLHTSPVVYSDPGFSGANLQYVYVDVDGTRPENEHPAATPDSGENIDVVTVPLADLAKTLQGYIDEDMAVDARLQTFADTATFLAMPNGPLTAQTT
ncbi:NUDIX hydrolase domain-like protein, partial [Syncephalis pseudoplumigaleata]